MRVYETVEAGDDLLVALEFVEGQTLRVWLQQPRELAEIVATLRDAARGLLAAHEAGIVHGDFKPDNVLVGDDGRVRVADLGLARVEAEALVTEEPQIGSGSGTATSGTPGYLAPECVDGAPPSAAADQFAFCSTLHEALLGELPLGREGRPLRRSAPTVPRRIIAVLRRGLSADPRDRFTSMAAVLAALERRPRAGATWALVALTLVGSAGLTAVMLAEESCSGGSVRAQSAWNDAARGTITARYPRPVAGRIAASVDAWAADWIGAHRAACLAGGEALDPTMRCLDAQLDALREALGVLEDGVPHARATGLPYGLPAPRSCRDGPRPPDDREALARLQTARALQLAGRFEASIEIADAVRQDAQARGDESVWARALMRIASAEQYLGRVERARDLTERALELATAADDVDAASQAAAALVFLCGYNLADAEAAARYARFAQAGLKRGDLGPESRAELSVALGSYAFRRGDYASAVRHDEDALRIRRAIHGDAHPDVALAMSNLAHARQGQGDSERALQLQRRALAIRTKSLGPDHPDVAESLHGLGGALRASDPRAARSYFERALAIRERTQGRDHPEAAGLHVNLATIALQLDELGAADPHLDRAQAIAEADPAATAVLYAVHTVRAQIHARRGEYDDAVASFRAAIDAWGPPSAQLASVWRELATAQRAQGRNEAAAQSEQQATAIEVELDSHAVAAEQSP